LSRAVVPACPLDRHGSRVAKEHDWNALMAAELGHEIRSVVSLIETLGPLPRDGLSLTADLVEIFDDLLLTSERARRLSQRMIDLSRDTLCERPTDICATVSRLVSTLRRGAPRNVTVVVDVNGGPLWTSLSALEVEQVVFNLAHNWFDAMSAGGVLAIEVTVAEHTSVLAVRSSGVDIDQDTLLQGLEPLFTTEAERCASTCLHAVRDVVEHAGGRVTVDNAQERGAMLLVYLPLLDIGATSYSRSR
jgi:signal transduction histidine kinase